MKRKKRVLHISTECHPITNGGSVAEVVGTLPVYQKTSNWTSSVITPRYDLPWYEDHEMIKVLKGSFRMKGRKVKFNILKASKDALPFEYYAVDIPELFMQPGIFSADNEGEDKDEAERNIAFQCAVLKALSKTQKKYDILHCHDHQTGLISFLIKHAPKYKKLKDTPCICTIHNGGSNSRYSWKKRKLLPKFDKSLKSIIVWDRAIDAIAAGLKFADHINAVSPSYLQEHTSSPTSLQLISGECSEKFSVIHNGINTDEWDPKKDRLINYKLRTSIDIFKQQNKYDLLKDLYQVDDIPLVGCIGKFTNKKGTNTLIKSMKDILRRFGFVNFFILGSGDSSLENRIKDIALRYKERVACHIGYDEQMVHKVYAASDFIVMPPKTDTDAYSHMIAMRYGALPVTRCSGEINDTVTDYTKSDGNGITFDRDRLEDLTEALGRAMHLYRDKTLFHRTRNNALAEDHSWSKSSGEYVKIYERLIKADDKDALLHDGKS